MTKKGCCVIPQCRNSSEKTCVLDAIYSKFPTREKFRRRWLRAIQSTFKNFSIEGLSSPRLCSDHFDSDCFTTNSKNGKRIFKIDAVPTDFTTPKKQPKEEPEVELPRARHHARRAASKEALKQMQILLEDEDDAVELPDDDYDYKAEISEDIKPVSAPPLPPPPPPPVPVLPPPKKKYKLTHRKSADGNDREVLVLKSITPNITNHYVENNLELECWVEELEPCQKERNKKLQEEDEALKAKLDELIKACKGEVVYKGDLTTVIEVSEHVQKTIQAVQASHKKPPVVLNNAVANPANLQLVMDPRLGLIMGSVPTKTPPATKPGKIQVATNLQATVTPASQTAALKVRTQRTRKSSVLPVTQTPAPLPPPPPAPAPPMPMTTRSVLNSKQTGKRTATQPPPAPTPPATRSRVSEPPPPPPTLVIKPPVTRSRQSMETQQQPAPPPVRAPSPPATRSRPGSLSTATPKTSPAPAAVSSGNLRPSESSVQGGLAAGATLKPKAIVDLTTDDGRPLPDSREVSFNKLQGKTYPSLVVVARPQLRVTDVNAERSKLDSKVKSALMFSPAKFTEWLIQQGLVKSEQACSSHPNTQMKLGMYSDVSKFPFSGGYVWISECCPQRFVSVFSGSIFEGAPHPPLVILKILYHWACQTNVQNVIHWVKVDNLYVKGIYTWLRSICTVALHTHMRLLGGPQVKVEVGIISLGSPSQDGSARQVKMEVLGVLETNTQLLRLRAVEPVAEGERNCKKRSSKVLEPLTHWVHKQSTIVTDLSVDKMTLQQMGFASIIHADATNSNRTIMDYLRRVVPRMFQNTLSLLSKQIIQQFLDELVWREWFGTTSMQAFDHLVSHLAEQTRHETGLSLVVRLNRVAQNPFKNWSIPPTSDTVIPPAVPCVPPRGPDTGPKKRKRKEIIETSPPPPPLKVYPAKQTPPKPATPKPATPKPVPPKQIPPKLVAPKPVPPKPAAPKPAPPKPVASVPIEVKELNRPPKSISPDVPEQMVPLENYYYGTVDNYPPKTNVTLNMKCPFCKEVYNNNIVLMSHLFKHAHNVSQDGEMCRYCLTSVPTANDLLKHIATAHPSETKHDNGFVCLICETQYMNPFVLGKHMSKEHCPSELPYQCSTCGYRCSNHKQAIDHFYKQHDNGPTIQCPFCLKSTTVFSSSRNIAQNMHYFIQHLQKHQRKQFAKRCGKCNLWFVQKDVLKDHQTKMHSSQRGKTGLVPWLAPRNGVMVPKSKMDKYPCDAEGIDFTTLFYNVSKGLKCKECNGPMDSNKHFPSFESCQNPNCQYSTCCSNAMQEHNAKCNKNSQPTVPVETLPYDMFCICGFGSKDGNAMAKHLTICEKKSAYPSLSDAKSASVTHSMLDVLGLVRKAEEGDKKVTAPSRTTKKNMAKAAVETIITIEEDEEPVKAEKARRSKRVASEDVEEPEVKKTKKDDNVVKDDKKIKEKEDNVETKDSNVNRSDASGQGTSNNQMEITEAANSEKSSDEPGNASSDKTDSISEIKEDEIVENKEETRPDTSVSVENSEKNEHDVSDDKLEEKEQDLNQDTLNTEEHSENIEIEPKTDAVENVETNESVEEAATSVETTSSAIEKPVESEKNTDNPVECSPSDEFILEGIAEELSNIPQETGETKDEEQVPETEKDQDLTEKQSDEVPTVDLNKSSQVSPSDELKVSSEEEKSDKPVELETDLREPDTNLEAEPFENIETQAAELLGDSQVSDMMECVSPAEQLLPETGGSGSELLDKPETMEVEKSSDVAESMNYDDISNPGLDSAMDID